MCYNTHDEDLETDGAVLAGEPVRDEEGNDPVETFELLGSVVSRMMLRGFTDEG